MPTLHHSDWKCHNWIDCLNQIGIHLFPIEYDQIKSYYDTIGSDEFYYKQICDYIEFMIENDSFKKDYYYRGPIFDNLMYIFKKITNNRIIPIFKNLLDNNNNNELKNVVTFDHEKLNILKKIVDDNFD